MIVTSLILMLKTTLSASARLGYTRLDKSGLSSNDISGRGIKNLSTVEKLAKSKKLDFAKVKSSGADFLTFRAKKVFIDIQKAFIKTPIFRHFDQECHIHIETDASEYVISEIFSQITSSQLFSRHVTYKSLNLNPKGKID